LLSAVKPSPYLVTTLSRRKNDSWFHMTGFPGPVHNYILLFINGETFKPIAESQNVRVGAEAGVSSTRRGR